MSEKIKPCSPQELNKIIADVFAEKEAKEARPQTPEEALVERSKSILADVNHRWNAYVKAHPGSQMNKAAAGLLISQMLIDRYRDFDKEELLFLVVMMQVEFIIERM
jgi:hypothetical protein